MQIYLSASTVLGVLNCPQTWSNHSIVRKPATSNVGSKFRKPQLSVIRHCAWWRHLHAEGRNWTLRRTVVGLTVSFNNQSCHEKAFSVSYARFETMMMFWRKKWKTARVVRPRNCTNIRKWLIDGTSISCYFVRSNLIQQGYCVVQIGCRFKSVRFVVILELNKCNSELRRGTFLRSIFLVMRNDKPG